MSIKARWQLGSNYSYHLGELLVECTNIGRCNLVVAVENSEAHNSDVTSESE